MEMQYVDSTSIDQMGYDAENQELHVIFKSGGRLCIYSQVPLEIWQSMLEAPSKGVYLAQVIKKNGYPYRYG